MNIWIFSILLALAFVLIILGSLKKPSFYLVPGSILLIILGALVLNPGIEYKSGEYKTFSYICSSACSESRNQTFMNFSNSVYPSVENTQYVYESFNYHSLAGVGIGTIIILVGISIGFAYIVFRQEENKQKNHLEEITIQE